MWVPRTAHLFRFGLAPQGNIRNLRLNGICTELNSLARSLTYCWVNIPHYLCSAWDGFGACTQAQTSQVPGASRCPDPSISRPECKAQSPPRKAAMRVAVDTYPHFVEARGNNPRTTSPCKVRGLCSSPKLCLAPRIVPATTSRTDHRFAEHTRMAAVPVRSGSCPTRLDPRQIAHSCKLLPRGNRIAADVPRDAGRGSRKRTHSCE